MAKDTIFEQHPPTGKQPAGKPTDFSVRLQEIETDKLLFDFANPRLTDERGVLPKTDEDMISLLSDTEDVDELLRSIAQNGYMPFDDIIAVQDGDRYRVLEGNRRLAAIRLFKNPELAAKLKITLPQITSEKLATLEKILVKLVATADVARAFIGFKHINGPHKWDALAKARFAAKWIDGKVAIAEIARTLGDSHNTVQRLIFGQRVLEQAKKNGFRVDDTYRARFAFSHLYTALSQAGYQDYLGISLEEDGLFEKKEPIPTDHLDKLLQLMRWLYGSKSENIPPVIQTQNPDLGRLNRVLLKPTAKSTLEGTNDLNVAYEAVEPKTKRFASSLVRAYQIADETLKLSSDFDGKEESLLETSQGLTNTAGTIHQIVEQRIKDQVAKRKK